MVDPDRRPPVVGSGRLAISRRRRRGRGRNDARGVPAFGELRRRDRAQRGRLHRAAPQDRGRLQSSRARRLDRSRKRGTWSRRDKCSCGSRTTSFAPASAKPKEISPRFGPRLAELQAGSRPRGDSTRQGHSRGVARRPRAPETRSRAIPAIGRSGRHSGSRLRPSARAVQRSGRACRGLRQGLRAHAHRPADGRDRRGPRPSGAGARRGRVRPHAARRNHHPGPCRRHDPRTKRGGGRVS